MTRILSWAAFAFDVMCCSLLDRSIIKRPARAQHIVPAMSLFWRGGGDGWKVARPRTGRQLTSNIPTRAMSGAGSSDGHSGIENKCRFPHVADMIVSKIFRPSSHNWKFGDRSAVHMHSCLFFLLVSYHHMLLGPSRCFCATRYSFNPHAINIYAKSCRRRSPIPLVLSNVTILPHAQPVLFGLILYFLQMLEV